MNTESKNENYNLHSKSERVAPYYVNMTHENNVELYNLV